MSEDAQAKAIKKARSKAGEIVKVDENTVSEVITAYLSGHSWQKA